MSFFYNRGELHEGRSFIGIKSRTEKYGYVPTRVLIENSLLSGKRFRAFNAGQFQYTAQGFNNFSIADVSALTVPLYSTELDIHEKQAFIAGVQKAYFDKIRSDKVSEDEKAAAKARFEKVMAAFEGKSTEVSAAEPAADTSPEA